jgi:hypothetical protein
LFFFVIQHDINKLIERISIDKENSTDIIQSFFQDRLFKYFKQKPYNVEISGPLKAQYEGTLDHIQEISPGLVERVLENPKRLHSIRDLLQQSTPLFASPLYVGMSKNLKARIMRHCNFIKQLREQVSNPFSKLLQYDLTGEERNFAERVVERELPSSRLFLAYQITDTNDENIYVDLENIINRIYYPSFGRN